jgi:hypothetical protein
MHIVIFFTWSLIIITFSAAGLRIGENSESRCGIPFKAVGVSARKEVVIGMATGNTRVFDFVVSLRNTGYSGDIVFGMDETSIALNNKAWLEQHCVMMMPTEDSMNNGYHPAVQRYFAYRNWLSAYEGDARVLLIDVRDTIFQRNPFSDFLTYTEGGKLLLLFADPHPFADPKTGHLFHHSDLTDPCFSKSKPEELVSKLPPDQMILCSGSTQGTTMSILHYLSKMELAINETRCFVNRGIDQGYHNLIWLRGDLPNAKVYKPGEGPIITFTSLADFSKNPQSSNYRALRFDTNGHVLNDDGTVVPTIHGWDRMRIHFTQTGWLRKTLLDDQAMNWMQQKTTRRDAEHLLALDKPRECHIEFVDDCSICGEGIQGCLKPVRKVCGGQASKSANFTVTFASGALCQDVRVASGIPISQKTCKEMCPWRFPKAAA